MRSSESARCRAEGQRLKCPWPSRSAQRRPAGRRGGDRLNRSPRSSAGLPRARPSGMVDWLRTTQSNGGRASVTVNSCTSSASNSMPGSGALVRARQASRASWDSQRSKMLTRPWSSGSAEMTTSKHPAASRPRSTRSECALTYASRSASATLACPAMISMGP